MPTIAELLNMTRIASAAAVPSSLEACASIARVDVACSLATSAEMEATVPCHEPKPSGTKIQCRPSPI